MSAMRLVIATAAALLVSTITALAAPGTIVISALVYAQPNTHSQLVNKLPVGYAVDLGACDHGWCLVTALGVTGFTPQTNVQAGAPPAPQPQPQPQPQRPNPDFSFDFGFGNANPGPLPPNYYPPRHHRRDQACFYSRTNFRGDSFCLERGDRIRDLPRQWDQRIRSVEVFGRARVDLCRGEFLQGTCLKLRSSRTRLPFRFDSKASSLEVY